MEDDVPDRQQKTSYPSPDAGHMASSTHPFYTGQQHMQHMPSADELHLSAQLSQHEASQDASRGMTALSVRDTDNIEYVGNAAGMRNSANDAQTMQQNYFQAPSQGPGPASQQRATPAENRDHSSNDDDEPRKRAKVSRACDECRRKKQRCDAADTSGAKPCSNCVRWHSTCSFARVPLKRGPSKGYIKELSDSQRDNEVRLKQLEQLVKGSHQEYSPEPAHPTAILESYGPPLGPLNRIPVTINQSSEDVSSPAQTSRVYTDSPGLNFAHLSTSLQAGQSSVDLTNFRVANQINPDSDAMLLIFEIYYKLVHPVLPFLPHRELDLRRDLQDVPLGLRDALLNALNVMVSFMPTSTVTTETLPAAGKVDLIKQASETVLALLNASSSMTNETSKRVMFQTIIATVIAIDLLGPPNHRVRNFPSANVLLAAAVALADGSKLGVPSTRKATSQDEDSKYSMRRRIWFTLVVLDRFYSVGTAMSLRVSNLSTVIAPEDRDLLGENFYHLVRLSCVMGAYSEVMSHTALQGESPGPETTALLLRTLYGQLERIREGDVAAFEHAALLKVTLLHMRMLIWRIGISSEIADQALRETLAVHATFITDTLVSTNVGISPLGHHLLSFTACTLADLTRFAATKERALDSLCDLRRLVGPEGRLVVVQSGGWDKAVRNVIDGVLNAPPTNGAAASTEPETMRGLAAAATGLENGATGAVADGAQTGLQFDWSVLGKEGYLNVL